MNQRFYFNSTFRIKDDAAKTSPPQRSGMRRSGRSTLRVGKPLRAVRLTTKDSEARIKQELTKLTSLIVRTRDRVCVLCGSAYRLQNGHFFHRDMPPTEFDLENCHALCARCNNRHEYQPAAYTEWIKTKLGEVRFAGLEFRAHQQAKLGYLDLWELREQYRAMLKGMLAA